MIVVFSAEARLQLRAITNYIARDNEARARSFARELGKKATSIGEMPFAHPVDDRLTPKGIRRCVHRNYLIFFQVERENVRIVSIIHGARDYASILQRGEPPP